MTEPMTELNRRISRLLSIGLTLSVALLLAGVVLSVTRPGAPAIQATSLADIPAALAALEPGGFFDLGLLILVLNPVARVVALAVGFARRGLWLFSVFSIVVLAVLGLSAYAGLIA